MKVTIRTFSSLSQHPDRRWDSEYLCFEPCRNDRLKYIPIGNALASSQYGISIQMNEENIGTKIYRMNEIGNMLCNRNVLKHAELDVDEIDTYRLKDRDVLFNRTNSQAFVGRTGIFRQSTDEDIVFASYLVRITPKPEIITPEYLTAFLNTKHGILDVKRRARISINQSNVNAEELRRVEIPLLSKELQTRITLAFNAAFNAVRSSGTRYHRAQAIVLAELGLADWQPKHQSSFVRNLSEARGAERIDADYFQPKYDDIINSIKRYSGGWYTLGDLVTLRKCIEVGSEQYLDRGVPFIRVSNLSPLEISKEKYISKDLYDSMRQHQPERGEILFSKDATPGIAHYLREQPQEMIVSSGILRLKSKTSKISDEYLTVVLNSIITKEQANRDVGGSVILHWRPDQIANVAVPILPDETQHKIQDLLVESSVLHQQSKHLLECAKRAVELAIEQDEQTAIAWLGSEASTQSQSQSKCHH